MPHAVSRKKDRSGHRNSARPVNGGLPADAANLLSLSGWGWTLGAAIIFFLGGASSLYPALRGWCLLVAAVMMVFVVRDPRFRLRDAGLPGLLLALGALLVIIQAIPLPAGWSAGLPGRDWVAELDRVVFGEQIARPLSLDPDSTPRALFFLFTPAILYLAMRFGNASRQVALLRGVALAIGVGFLIQLVQVTTGTLYFFDIGHKEFGPAFFTNRNHMATFLLMAAAMVSALLLGRGEGRIGGAASLIAAGITALSLIGVLLTGSRAGLVMLALFCVLMASAYALEWIGGTRRNAMLVGAGALLLAIGSAYAIGNLIGGAEDARGAPTGGALAGATQRAALATDARYEIWDVSSEMAVTYFPAGAGFGSFRELYEKHEPLEIVGPLYSNHAHNDFLEIAIEGGLPAILILLAYLAWVAWALRGRFMAGYGWVGFALLALPTLLVLAHSMVDYPVRTVAVAALLALHAGWLASPVVRK